MSQTLYNAAFQQALFDEMQASYERVSNITSFGFNLRWRRQLVALLDMQHGMYVGDLMAGSGESWVYILPKIGDEGCITAVDFSRQMIEQARQRQSQLPGANIVVLHQNALCSSIPSGSVDVVLCVYGVKTLAPCQQEEFVSEVWRILRPGGVFGLVEVSVPASAILRIPYLFYLGKIVPIVGKLLLGNPDNYRMLATYVAAFGDCRVLQNGFKARGFDVRHHNFFGGCATALVGRKYDDMGWVDQGKGGF